MGDVPHPLNTQTSMETLCLQYNTRTPNISIEDFQISQSESLSLEQLRLDLFRSMLVKKCLEETPALPSMINCIREQTSEKEKSNIAYIEIVSEKADSLPTLVKVL